MAGITSLNEVRGPWARIGLIGGFFAALFLAWLAATGLLGFRGSAAVDAFNGTVRGYSPASMDDSGSSALGVLPELVWPQAAVNCTLETTQTAKADSTWNNHDFNTNIQVSNYTNLSLVGTGDPGDSLPTTPDYYRLDNATVGALYTIQAKPDRTVNYNLGIIVYNANHDVLIVDEDTSSYSASVSLVADSAGPYFFEVYQVSAQCTGYTYSLIYNYTGPTSTPTATPTGTPGPTSTPAPAATWMPGFDQYEPNFEFDIATTIAPGLNYEMNFVPWGGAQYDNDYLKIRVKSGLQLTCETSDLDPAVDPRMVFYNGPSDQNFIMANDDIALGDFNSRLSYYANYDGYVYILIGQGTRMARRDTVNSSYTISCDLTVPGAPTPAPGQPTPISKAPEPTAVRSTATPTPQTSVIATPTPTPESGDVDLNFRLVTRPEAPTPSPEPNGFRTFRVIVYFDADLDGQMGAGEGIAGFFVQVLSPDGSSELAQGYTDEQGQLSFTVPTVGTVRVLIPLLGYDRLIDASKPEVKVRLVPPTLPDAIP